MHNTTPTTFTEIDKLALIAIKNKKILSSRTRGRSVWYIPGGKREKGENDVEALQREIKEELNITLSLSTLRYMGVYKAQADNHQPGIIVKMTCYYCDYEGEPQPTNEVEEIKYLSYADRYQSSPADQLIFEALYNAGLIA
ncbi:NUDIX domain-containing protein [Inquilinus sp. KBS0705]|nr:NUDIX domain-containing protein [Inquilinus sp. KBS0705]